MKKAFPILCLLLAMVLIASLWTLHYIRNNHRNALLASPMPSAHSTYRIDLNTADVDALSYLPGVGEALAQRIVDYRNTHGNFSDISQLQNVSGIGPQLYSQIAHLLVIGGSQ